MLIGLALPRYAWLPRIGTVAAPLFVTFAIAVTWFYFTTTDSWAVLASVLLFIGLLSAFLLMVPGRTTKIETLVERRTNELRLGEDRFKDFAESSSDWFWEMDADLRYSYISQVQS